MFRKLHSVSHSVIKSQYQDIRLKIDINEQVNNITNMIIQRFDSARSSRPIGLNSNQPVIMKTCVAVITLTNCHGGIKVTGDVTSTILYNNKTLYNTIGPKTKKGRGRI